MASTRYALVITGPNNKQVIAGPYTAPHTAEAAERRIKHVASLTGHDIDVQLVQLRYHPKAAQLLDQVVAPNVRKKAEIKADRKKTERTAKEVK